MLLWEHIPAGGVKYMVLYHRRRHARWQHRYYVRGWPPFIFSEDSGGGSKHRDTNLTNKDLWGNTDPIEERETPADFGDSLMPETLSDWDSPADCNARGVETPAPPLPGRGKDEWPRPFGSFRREWRGDAREAQCTHRKPDCTIARSHFDRESGRGHADRIASEGKWHRWPTTGGGRPPSRLGQGCVGQKQVYFTLDGARSQYAIVARSLSALPSHSARMAILK